MMGVSAALSCAGCYATIAALEPKFGKAAR
jgi:hypothetical protein